MVPYTCTGARYPVHSISVTASAAVTEASGTSSYPRSLAVMAGLHPGPVASSWQGQHTHNLDMHVFQLWEEAVPLLGLSPHRPKENLDTIHTERRELKVMPMTFSL